MTVIKSIIVMFLLNGNGSFTKWPLAGVVRAQSAAQVLGLTLSPADFCGEGAAVGRGVAAASVIPAGMWGAPRRPLRGKHCAERNSVACCGRLFLSPTPFSLECVERSEVLELCGQLLSFNSEGLIFRMKSYKFPESRITLTPSPWEPPSLREGS